MEYKSNNNVVYFCRYHVAFCPKYRRAVLIDGVEVRLKELIEKICEELSAEIVQIEIQPDYVYLLIQVLPQYGIHKTVKQIKARSSRTLRQEFPWLKSRLPSLWTNSYFVSTVDRIPISAIKKFIKNQKNI